MDMKLKPSPEELADGKEAPVLALVWALMMRFMKIGDDEDTERLNAKDALLMWVQGKVLKRCFLSLFNSSSAQS